MKDKDRRFLKIYSEGTMSGVEILVDRVTGVHYLCNFNGYPGGITVLLDENGKPVIQKPKTE